MLTHSLGFPRIGAKRELKWALEQYWRGEIDESALNETAFQVRRRNWEIQRDRGIELLPVGDFSLYDHILDTAFMLDAIPERFREGNGQSGIDTYFCMARGDAEKDIPAMEMTKWFDTNYHYIVPELAPDQAFTPNPDPLLEQLQEVNDLGMSGKPVLPGPLTFLLLSRSTEKDANTLDLLPALTEAYAQILSSLANKCEWIQIDEPILVQNLPKATVELLSPAYENLAKAAGPAKLLLTTYFEGAAHHAETILSLPVAGIHLDLVRAPQQLDVFLQEYPKDKTLSLGVVDGRNVWKTDLNTAVEPLKAAIKELGEHRVMAAPSCSMLHVPVDLEAECKLDGNIRNWLAFAAQKCTELRVLAFAARDLNCVEPLKNNANAIAQRRNSPLITNPEVRKRAITKEMTSRNSVFEQRSATQQERLGLPALPTTTIGSFPQTEEVRKTRAAFRHERIDAAAYEDTMREYIKDCVRKQEAIGLDVLVHGEPERTDMVEYFGRRLDGFCFTDFGWVQSYGSRCVKPPIIYGDISRPAPMTVEWTTYAASLTDKPLKGMLTGPVTILCWSFVRDDMERMDVCRQIALAIRDEVADLEAAGIGVIQIDEPAFREGLPLQKGKRKKYLADAVESFRIASCCVRDETQIHTHMCYADFNDVIEHIAAMDADVISIEASRSAMELLEAFADFRYPNDIGPGVWDIHSARVPSAEEMAQNLRKATRDIPAARIWANPDCGLKTRAWPETLASLENLVKAAKIVRNELLT
ncbi:5-methyltetrahydropteroyltriglutamate--homocysteine S-methyltransferase [Salidesulfovibrio brasiliensis]|uniref:5-methyltetrahydropteroyltriglutamate-- homocysteine S-methyltransferase n=1 Tax=Salidesulfovibrio brasiliensis TaxID=221711 RepID=UPI0006D08CA7|nr:5-methyltetrahydropteroyltriglutamate--homocysteine S-methyltransferase [Salidesulfovibrio brasiliensis]